MAKTYRKRVKTEGRVENRSDLFNYILAKLTSDSIPVQDDQVHIAIDDAWEKFNNHHHLANEEFFAIYRYTDEDLARFASPPVICLIEKNDRKPFLKTRPFSKSKFYTESFEGLNETKKNQSYLPIKNGKIDSDAVLDGLEHEKAFRHEVKIKRLLLNESAQEEPDELGNRVDAEGNKIEQKENETLEDYQNRTSENIVLWEYNNSRILFDGTVKIDDTATVRHYNNTIKEYPYKESDSTRTKALPLTKSDGTKLDDTEDEELLSKKLSEITIDDGLFHNSELFYIIDNITGTYHTLYAVATKIGDDYVKFDTDSFSTYAYDVGSKSISVSNENEIKKTFFDKGNNPALMDDEFIEESDEITEDQWYYLVRKMKSDKEIEVLLEENESNVNEYENIIQNDMIDFEKVDRNYLADKQYGYFFSNGIYWSQSNQNDLIVNNIFVDLPEDIGSITKIVNATGQSFGTFFTGLENTALLNSSFASVYGASTAGVGALMQFDMVGFFVMNRHFDMMNKYIVSEQPIGFSFQNKRLYIYDSVKRFVKGDTMMMKGYKRSSNVSQGDLWNNIWLKEYATALTQRQWALNITNASGVTGPGNATLPAQEILAEANTQIEKLETQLYNSLQPGSRIISG